MSIEINELGIILGFGGILLTVITWIVGLIYGYILYRKSLRVKRPYWSMQSTNLINNDITQLERLQVLYNNDKLSNLSISKVAFWNYGSESLRQDDISKVASLRILALKDVRLLEVEVLKITDEANLLKVSLLNEKEISIEFDYLNQGDGVVFQILHTGTTNEDILLDGKIIGAKLERTRVIRTDEFSDNIIWQTITPGWRRLFLITFIFPAGLFFVGLGLIPVLALILPPFSFFDIVYSFLGGIMIFYGVQALRLGRELVKYRIPSDLQIFDR